MTSTRNKYGDYTLMKNLTTIFVLLFASLCWGQDPGTGTPAFDAFSHAGGGIDTINLGNLNVHMAIPLRSLGAYGPKAETSLVMDSFGFATNSGNLNGAPSFAFSLSTNTDTHALRAVHRTGTSCADYEWITSGVTDGHNTFHPTPQVILDGCNTSFSVSGPGTDGWSIGGTTDSTGHAAWIAIGPNGDIYDGADTDPHGNSVKWSGYTLQDALGNTALTKTVGTNGITAVSYPGPNGTTPQYTFNLTTYTVQPDFGCGGALAGSTQLVTGITFPDLSTMSFTYEPVYNNASYRTGRIKSVKLRTGATITYDYTGYGTSGVNCSDGSTAGFKKITPDGTWVFTHSAPSGTNKLSTTTVKSPTGDTTTYTFSGLYPVYRSDAFTSTTICYNGNTTTCTNPPTTPTLPITERDVYSSTNGVTSPSLKVFIYDTYSRLTDVKTYDFGGVRNGANFSTEEQTKYGTYVANGDYCGAATEVVQGISVPITGLVCAYQVYTPGVTAEIHGNRYSYAANTADLTTRLDIGGGVWMRSDTTYDSLGRPTSSTGPNGEASTITYSNCAGKLPYQFTSKASSSITLTQIIDSMDCTGELPLHGLDANNQPATIVYDGDPFWRPMSVTDAAGTATTFSYTPNSKTSRTLVTSSSVKESVETLDSMGRGSVSQQRQGPTSAQYNSVETDYDIDGRVSRVTTPYQAGLGGTNGSIVATLYAYDAINRPTTVTSPNGTVKSFTYNASGSSRDTLVSLNSGPNGERKQTQYEYNGLGRVTSVCEVTSMTGSYGCGQVNPVNGFKTSYTYSGPGNLLNIKQNDGGSVSQNRSFTYENSNTGRMLTATTPEAGTFHLTYDSDGTCGTFIGAVVKKADNGGGTTCLSYDLLGRVTSKTYSGLNSANTQSKNYIYDNTTNANIQCPTGSNWNGRLAEVTTGGGAPNGWTDEGFCYDVVGNTTDVNYWLPAWIRVSESYFPTGIPKTLTIGNQPTITYGLDPMARIYSAGASGGGQNPLTGVNYNIAGLPTAVNFGSGDSSAYGWLNGIGPMNSATFNVGSGSASNALTWNANGTLQKLAITDTLNSADTQTCTYSYDDLSRLLTDNCGSVWNQSFGYDPFGNVTKSGSSSWMPGYSQTTNRYQLADTAYDINGRLTNDTFDSPIAWDIEGNIATQSSVGFAYDGLGRNAGSVVGATWTNYIYAPDGSLFATANNLGGIQKMFVPLPMSTAVYNSSGTIIQYRRNDWQGSVRVSSTPTKTLYSSTAYGAFGEPYAPKGPTNNQFAGLTSDISSGTEQVSGSRRYHPTQGRWISPDGGIPNILNPQMFNAYHYALNSPVNSTDPGGNDEQSNGQVSEDALAGIDPGGTNPNSGDFSVVIDGIDSTPWSSDPGALPDANSSTMPGLGSSGYISDNTLGPADGSSFSSGASSGWSDGGGTCQANGWVGLGGGIQISKDDFSRALYPTPQEQATQRHAMVDEMLRWGMIGAVGSPFGARGVIGGPNGVIPEGPAPEFSIKDYTTKWVEFRKGESFSGENTGVGGDVNPAQLHGFTRGVDPLWMNRIFQYIEENWVGKFNLPHGR